MNKYMIALSIVLGALACASCNKITIESVDVIGPDQFDHGVANFRIEHLGRGEELLVAAVHASQIDPRGFMFDINADGLMGDVGSLGVATLAQRPALAPDPKKDEHERHSPLWTKVWNELSHGTRVDTQNSQNNLPASTCLPPYHHGQVCDFSILDYNDAFQQEPAQVRYVSEHFVAFVENKSARSMSDSDVKGLIQWLETAGLPSDQKYFGDLPDVDQNGKAFVVFTSHLMNPKTHKGIVGYVGPWDMLPVEDCPSNGADVLFALTPDVMEAAGHERSDYFDYSMKSTLVHELKHLIAMGYRVKNNLPFEELWLEEPSAVAAEELAGFGSRLGFPQYQAKAQLQAPEMFSIRYDGRPSDNDENAGLYGMNFLFLWRQAEKIGHDQFWRNFVESKRQGIGNIETQTHAPMSEAMLDFAKLLYFDHTGALGLEDYKHLNLKDGTWENVGTRPLKNGDTLGSTRSMAYYVGSGRDSSVDLRFDVDFKLPYFLVVKYQP